jgi:hypothetical protein
VTQSNAKYQALDTLTFHIHTVRKPVGFGKVAETSKGRPMSVMTHLKRSIVEVKTDENCLAHALVIAMAKVRTIPITKPIGKGEKSCPKSANCCKRKASISAEEEESRTTGLITPPFTVQDRVVFGSSM